MIIQKLIRIKTANEALYTGRLLPKKAEKTKKAQKQKHIYPYKTKTNNYSYCHTAKKDQNKRKFITRAKIQKTKKSRIKREEKSKKYPG